MALLLTVVIFWLFILLAAVYYVVPALLQHKRLVKEYRNISFLSLSSIPFVGNIHLIDKRPDVFFQFLCQLAKQAQDKNKGLFCLWYSLWPMVFICSGQGLEVYLHPMISISEYFISHHFSHLLIMLNKMSNLLITLFLNRGLKLVYSRGNISRNKISHFLYY